MRYTFLFLIFFLPSLYVGAQPSQDDIDKVIYEVNKLRQKGCYCGSRWMPPVRPVTWDNLLYKVSRQYAQYMYRNNHFSHFSKTGEDLGDRLDKFDYQWQKIGENIGYGYKDFYGVFEAWQESPSHCKMLMDPDVTQMGLSKYYTYWVQSFSRPIQGGYRHTSE